MQGRQEQNARMDQLDEVVDDAWFGARPEPGPQWECLSYSVSFSEEVLRHYPGEYDDLVEDVLLGISEGPPRPGERLCSVIDWSGFVKLAAESYREHGSDRVHLRARMCTIWDDPDNLSWDCEDEAGGEEPSPDDT